MIGSEHCEKCEKYKNKLEEALKHNNSAYDAACDMWGFVRNCFETCEYNKNKTTKKT